MHKYLFTFLIVFLILPTTALASMVVRADESVSVGVDETVEGDFYGFGQQVSVSGEVLGDSILLGGDVSMNGVVSEDVFILGGIAKSYASVTEDMRVVAGEVTIAEDVGGDLLVVGGMVRILSSATIGGDVLLFGGQAIIEGEVEGSIFGTVGTLRIDAPVGDSVDVTVEQLTLGEQAVIAGSVQYTSAIEVTRATQSVVEGEIVRSDPVIANQSGAGVRSVAIAFLAMLFAAVVVFLLFQRQTLHVVEIATTRPLRVLMLGLGVFLATIPVALLVTASVLASLIGLLLLSLWLSILLISLMIIPIIVGEYARRYIQADKPLSPLHISIGAAVLFVAILVPIVGLILYIGLLFMAFGAIVMRIYQAAG